MPSIGPCLQIQNNPKKALIVDYDSLEIVQINKTFVFDLVHLFEILRNDDTQGYFHPHPLNNTQAEKLANYDGEDLYYLMMCGKGAIGYGMLRGWDEGFGIPSLGLAIHPAYRGKGLGLLFMHFLHAAAQCRGANSVRLTVSKSNVSAIRLYEKLGYELDLDTDDRYIGFFNL
jgi:ribosomal-protein-alanine N-acetyltransferase